MSLIETINVATNTDLLTDNLVTDERFNSLPPADRWMATALCSTETTDLFFSDDFDEIATAKRICMDCPVQARCLDAAVERNEQYGIWGGHVFDSGRIVLQKRRRGRPRLEARSEDAWPQVPLPEAYQQLVTTT